MAITNDSYTASKLGIPFQSQPAQQQQALPPPSLQRAPQAQPYNQAQYLPQNRMMNPPGPQGMAQQLAAGNVQYPQMMNYQNPLVQRNPGVPPQWNFTPSSSGSDFLSRIRGMMNPLM